MPVPPGAFAQGAGIILQVAGVLLFLTFFSVCCLSSLISKDQATSTQLTHIAWRGYSAQRAITICLVCGVFLGLALAAAGLGLQARRRFSACLAAAVTAPAMFFWIFHAVFFARVLGSIVLALLASALASFLVLLLILSLAALYDMWRHPPPRGMEILPPDYKIPYSHLHADSPEVRLARELQQRRNRLEIQQKELELLEQKLHDKRKPDDN